MAFSSAPPSTPRFAFWKLPRPLKSNVKRSYPPQKLVSLVPSPLWVIFAITSVQLGAVLAESLFQALGLGGTIFLRHGLAALVLLLVWCPRIRGYRRADYALVMLFGLTIAAMNTLFYAAIARIPLGIATAVEFLGPLGVALLGSRRWYDLLWAFCAAVGILLLSLTGTLHLEPVGIGLALLAGLCWAAYILLGVRVGHVFAGGSGLALAMSVAALVLFPLGIGSSAALLRAPQTLLIACGVAVLSTLLPFSCELEALRRVPARTFGILMSLEPAVATGIGWLLLKEAIGWRALLALLLIVLASVGSSVFQDTSTTTIA